MNDTTLKPCPFCGSPCFFNHEDATDSRGNEYVRAWVECTGCDMRSIAKRAAYGIPTVKVMLAELWNRRVATPAVPQAEAKVGVDVARFMTFVERIATDGDWEYGDDRDSEGKMSDDARALIYMLASKAAE